MSFFGLPIFLKVIAKQDKNDLNRIYLLFLSSLFEVAKPGFYLGQMMMMVMMMMVMMLVMIIVDDNDQDDPLQF